MCSERHLHVQISRHVLRNLAFYTGTYICRIILTLKESVHFINAHNILLTIFRINILHDIVYNNVSFV